MIMYIYILYISQFSLMESQHVFIFPVPDLSMLLFANKKVQHSSTSRSSERVPAAVVALIEIWGFTNFPTILRRYMLVLHVQ